MREPVDEQLSNLAIKIERLRKLYEQYFLGIEKAEPVVARTDIEREFTAMQKGMLRNTVLRFRYQMLQQRWDFLNQRWRKVLRQIEEGTYGPLIARAKRRGYKMPRELARRSKKSKTTELDLSDVEEIHDEQNLTDEFAALPEMDLPERVPGMSDDDLVELHQRLEAARRSKVDFEQLVSSLERQVPALQKQLKSERIRFDLVESKGKVTLKARAKS